MTFSVLFVCTGNICRSPIAELMTRALLDEHLAAASADVVVGSAGTWGHAGSPMEPEARGALASWGIDGSAFRARELTAAMVGAADLILTASREHAVAALALAPSEQGRMFLLTEFACLVAGVDGFDLPAGSSGAIAERGTAIVRAADRLRAADASPVDADLADPYGAPQRVFTETAAQVRALVMPFVTLLAAAAPATPGSSPIACVGTVQP